MRTNVKHVKDRASLNEDGFGKITRFRYFNLEEYTREFATTCPPPTFKKDSQNSVYVKVGRCLIGKILIVLEKGNE